MNFKILKVWLMLTPWVFKSGHKAIHAIGATAATQRTDNSK